jgi:hypothetical protein
MTPIKASSAYLFQNVMACLNRHSEMPICQLAHEGILSYPINQYVLIPK